jgi:hypothetical protein
VKLLGQEYFQLLSTSSFLEHVPMIPSPEHVKVIQFLDFLLTGSNADTSRLSTVFAALPSARQVGLA